MSLGRQSAKDTYLLGCVRLEAWDRVGVGVERNAQLCPSRLDTILPWTRLEQQSRARVPGFTQTQNRRSATRGGPDTVSWWFLKQRLGLPMVR